MAGTFTIKFPTSVTANSAPSPGWGGGTTGAALARPTSDASLLAGIASLADENPSLFAGWVSGGPGSVVGTWLTRFGWALSDAVISLDGNPAISFNSLPSGAVPLTATLSVRTKQYSSANVDPIGSFFLQRNALTESANLGQVSLPSTTKSFVYTGALTFLDIINDGFGIRTVFATAGSIGQEYYNMQIVGTYEIQNFTWTIANDTVPVKIGDTVEIDSPDATPDLTTVTDVVLTYEDSLGSHDITIPTSSFIIWTVFIITFLIPSSLPDDFSGELVISANGTSFSGTVEIGTLTVYNEIGSGIYRIELGKTSDTQYRRGLGDTVEVKIPNPFFKTGFLGG